MACDTCTLRARFDRKPKSLLGRLWRWHIRFCPGWKAWLKGLPEDERRELTVKYGL